VRLLPIFHQPAIPLWGGPPGPRGGSCPRSSAHRTGRPGGRLRGRSPALLILVLFLNGCARHVEEYTRPEEITEFKALFSQNCSGCHGAEGRHGAAQMLNYPLYQHLVSKERLHKVITEGIRGTSMPGFSKMAGGFLTDKQIGILVDGMQEQWGGPQNVAGLPKYEADGAGDAQRGEVAYKIFCVRCHGADGKDILDGSYLALVTNQSLRTTVIAGRPDLQIPDWRGYVAGRAMTEQEISDVVAWIASHRLKENR
jgi:cytochrome c oxidase cbb3-type subunit III